MDTNPRFGQACQRCWRRKQKCDRLSPECSECLRVGSRCVQRVVGRAHGTFANDGDENVPRSQNLLELIRKRIAFLESYTDQNTGALPPSQESVSTGTNLKSYQVENASNQGNGTRNEQLMNNAASEIQYLPLTAMSGSDQHDYSLNKNPGFLEFVEQVMSLSGTDPALASISKMPQSAQKPLEISMCLQDLNVLSLASLQYFIITFCRFSGLQYLCFSQNHYLDALETIQGVDRHTENPNFNHEALFLVSVAVDIGLLLNCRKRQMTDLVSRLANTSKALIPILANTASDALIARYLTMQSILSLYQPSAASTWYTLGLAMTKSISIGAHHQTSSEADPICDESSYAFWTLYTLDRQVAFTMDRPFGIEEDDVTLQLADISTHSLSDSNDTVIACLRTWTIQHAQMLSNWRVDCDTSFEMAFSSYQYWQDTYQEILEHTKLTQISVDWNQEAFPEFVKKQSAQLACQALVQLCIVRLRKSPLPDQTSRLQEAVDTEVPLFISHTKTCMEQHDLTLTFLDAYDVFAATVMYLYFHNTSIANDQLLSPERITTVPLGVAGMKLVMAAMEIIQEVAERFTPLQGLKEVLWAFLAAIEKKSCIEQTQQSANAFESVETPIQMLHNSVECCTASTPLHLKRLMENCLQDKRNALIT